jgi:pyruvate dehydrogenase E2 component (dihydrolipoamide acetyltransferase)
MTSQREIRLPALSATMEEATLLEWKVAPGDAVREGDAIAEVQTDKVDMDLEAPFTGTIVELVAAAGSAVELGGILATIETEADDFLADLNLDAPASRAEPEPAAAASQESDETAPETPSDHIVPASPPARMLAKELGVDLAAVAPTGARGQVTPRDVRTHADGTTARPTASPPATPAPPPVAAPIATAPAHAATPVADARRNAVRKATAQIMSHSATIPQFTLYRTLRLERAAAARNGRSWTTELVRAMAGALRAHPELNARWDSDNQAAVPWDAVRIGLAVDRPGTGLVVASISDPDIVTAGAADEIVRAVADRARSGKLRPEEMSQASITLSNLGGLGVERFNALLFPPQAAILSVGTIAMRPIATSDGGIKAMLATEVGLTIDHRVADGADGARFLATFAELMEA